MNQLPSEILSEIFFRLHQCDQRECMLVCCRWQQIIEEFVLYNTVYIYSIVSLEKLTKHMRQRSEIASKVERLIVCIGYQDEATSEANTLLCLLHNLRTLSYHVILNQVAFRNETEKTKEYPKLKYIERISEYTRDSVATQLLSSTVCPNLTILVVDDFRNRVIKFLKNAPALKKLTMMAPLIGFNELELIHESLPRLNSITFRSATFKDFELNEDFRLATSITECIFEDCHTAEFESLINLLVYISKKYPNLSNLSYCFRPGCPDDDDIKRINDYGWTPLIQRLGRQLKQLNINRGGHINNDFFEKLDRFYCQVNHLSLHKIPYSTFSKLFQSQQVFHIQTLVLEYRKLGTFDWLKELGQLKRLKLVACYYDESSHIIKMNEIIDNSPPTLRSLYLEAISLAFDLENTGLSHIHTLSLHWVELPENIDTLISHHFPQLSTLKLSISDQPGRIFNLETLDLSTVYFTNFCINKNYYTVVSTLNNNERRWYSVDGRKCTMMPRELLGEFYAQDYLLFKSWPENESGNVADFTLICNSVKNVVFEE